MLLSLFCGIGGLDLGFEQAQYTIGLAFDKNPDSLQSYIHNRAGCVHAHVHDVRDLTVEKLDEFYGAEFRPEGVIGGPPCQSFTHAVHGVEDDDPRHELPLVYATLIGALNRRSPVSFFVLENVTGLCEDRHTERFTEIKAAFAQAGFRVHQAVLNARDYSTPQNRERVFLVGLNATRPETLIWAPPPPTTRSPTEVTVRAAIHGLAEPQLFARGVLPDTFPVHRNHWCMRPKSQKFTRPGALTPGDGRHRSFKTLHWERPSFTVAYGHREVHVHPDCHRRLSVFESLLLQGFPRNFELLGNLSSQFNQISEAVPPPMAHAVALSLRALLEPQIAATPD